MNNRAIVLLSGGIDSTVCATLAARHCGSHEVIALSFSYGQKHATREIQAAIQVVERLELREWFCERIPEVFEYSKNALTDLEVDLPEKSYEELRQEVGVSPAYVPFRNGVMLSIATAVALQWEADLIYYGAHMDDGLNWAYPDCTPEFNGSMASAIYVGTHHAARLYTPLQFMDKADIVELGINIGAPLELTYSCYAGRDKACGKCSTCVNRLEAFKQVGVPDPIEYEKE